MSTQSEGVTRGLFDALECVTSPPTSERPWVGQKRDRVDLTDHRGPASERTLQLGFLSSQAKRLSSPNQLGHPSGLGLRHQTTELG